MILPLTLKNGVLELIGGHNLHSAAAELTSRNYSRVSDATVREGDVMVNERVQIGDEPRCCFSGKTSVLWHFVDGRWVPRVIK